MPRAPGDMFLTFEFKIEIFNDELESRLARGAAAAHSNPKIHQAPLNH